MTLGPIPADARAMRIRDRLGALRRLAGTGVYPPEFAWMLTLPVRRLILSPATLADRLELAPEDRVLEIGAGPGYFSVEVARRLPHGHLTVLDLQPEMLERARERLSHAGVTNVSCIAGDAAALTAKTERAPMSHTTHYGKSLL